MTLLEILQRLIAGAVSVGREAIDIWRAGGWAMVAIALVSLTLFGIGMSLCLRLWGKRYRRVPERRWRRWIDHPAERRGPIGELLDFVTGARSLKEIAVPDLKYQLRFRADARGDHELAMDPLCGFRLPEGENMGSLRIDPPREFRSWFADLANSP